MRQPTQADAPKMVPKPWGPKFSFSPGKPISASIADQVKTPGGAWEFYTKENDNETRETYDAYSGTLVIIDTLYGVKGKDDNGVWNYSSFVKNMSTTPIKVFRAGESKPWEHGLYGAIKTSLPKDVKYSAFIVALDLENNRVVLWDLRSSVFGYMEEVFKKTVPGFSKLKTWDLAANDTRAWVLKFDGKKEFITPKGIPWVSGSGEELTFAPKFEVFVCDQADDIWHKIVGIRSQVDQYLAYSESDTFVPETKAAPETKPADDRVELAKKYLTGEKRSEAAIKALVSKLDPTEIAVLAAWSVLNPSAFPDGKFLDNSGSLVSRATQRPDDGLPF